MSYKTPPAKSQGWVTGPVYVFEKSIGTASSTIYGRVVSRVPLIKLVERGAEIRVARYGGKLWRVYPPDIFDGMVRQWMKDGDRIYGDGNQPLELPLSIPFICDADKPVGPA